MITPGEVHLWRVDLDRPATGAIPLRGCLSFEECERAERFPLERDRTRYLVAHAVLRILLARCLAVPDYRAAFRTGPHGKPSLGPGAPLRFNLARSRGHALIAIAVDTEVGVDLEAVDQDTAIDPLVRRFFSLSEQREIRSIPSGRQRTAFFHVWCQKEAYLKARGEGIGAGLDHFDVIADPEEGGGIRADRKDPDAMRRWRLRSLDAPAGFRAALAWEGNASELHQREWTE